MTILYVIEGIRSDRNEIIQVVKDNYLYFTKQNGLQLSKRHELYIINRPRKDSCITNRSLNTYGFHLDNALTRKYLNTNMTIKYNMPCTERTNEKLLDTV